MSENTQPRERLIVALDVPDAQSARERIDVLSPDVLFYKVGLELFCAAGPALVCDLCGKGLGVFLDLKLHDIPRTVARTVRTVGGLGARLLTIHASGGREMIRQAALAARDCERPPRLIAVTALTSLDQSDLDDIGVARPLGDHVVALAEMAIEAGADGVVASPQETARLRERIGQAPLIVTPGIRPASGELGDQKRVATPASAIRDGASHLVVGRPILDASDPREAARAILREMETA